MLSALQLDASSETALYRQLYEAIRLEIELGSLRAGERLPATRELAGQLGLNRTTVSAAYALLDENGLIEGQVGRGSFVRSRTAANREPSRSLTSFSSSRPAGHEFPLEDFQLTCKEVTTSSEVASILQLGSPFGYAPLRRHLLEEARREGAAGAADDVLITSGCQQAFDLCERVLAVPGTAVVLEDPVYHGLRNVFGRSANRLVGVAAGPGGLDLNELTQVIEQLRPSLVVVTPNFQNPTGETLSLSSRQRLLEIVRRSEITLIENDMYGPLRYVGEPLPTLKQMDPDGRTLLLRSFSKIAFPGLRVGWIVGAKASLARLAEARQWCDLHTDQLSQAILLRFVESGRLEKHLAKVRIAGRQRLAAALEACEAFLPPGSSFSRPEGGMNLWVRLPEPVDASALLSAAEREQVSFLPGRNFAVVRQHPGSLRLSFGSLTPDAIRSGIATLGRLASLELQRNGGEHEFEAASAIV